MATLIWGANPLPTPAIGAAIPAGRSRRGGDDHWAQNHEDKKGLDYSWTSKDHSRRRVICWRNDGLLTYLSGHGGSGQEVAFKP